MFMVLDEKQLKLGIGWGLFIVKVLASKKKKRKEWYPAIISDMLHLYSQLLARMVFILCLEH